jgi:hypothetical protein
MYRQPLLFLSYLLLFLGVLGIVGALLFSDLFFGVCSVMLP